MYESIFGFQQRPFSPAAIVGRYFPAAATELARQTLSRGIERGEGPGMLAGSAGTGKTLLCHLLAEQFRDRYQVVMLATVRVRSARALLQNILFELGLPYRDQEEGELRLGLIDHLQRSEACPNGILLIVDEAHALPLKLLEEIRMITNLVRDDEPRVRLVVAGGTTLEERFAHPKLESLNQRIAARCYLEPMNREETTDYVRGQIAAVSGDPDSIFADDAYHAIHTASGGIPRLINQVCDHALVLAAAGGASEIDARGIEEAWADLQQLPTPSSYDDGESAESVVEFGQLDDDEEAVTATIPVTQMSDEPVEPLAAMTDPSTQLDQIEQQISEVSNSPEDSDPPPSDSEQFVSSATSSEQIELVVDNSNNPFEEAFTEEEVVVDTYAALDENVASQSPRPSEVHVPELEDGQATTQAEELSSQIVADESMAALTAAVEGTTLPCDAALDALAELAPVTPIDTMQWMPELPATIDSAAEPMFDISEQIAERVAEMGLFLKSTPTVDRSPPT